MASYSELLLDEYYRWEAIGRGEKLWDAPVSPEPYFVPFFYHGAFTGIPKCSDEGFRPSLLDRAKGLFKKSEKETDEYEDLLAQLDGAEPPEPILEDKFCHELAEYRVLLLPDQKVDQKKFEHFLYALGGLHFPVTFEVVAYGGVITLHFVVSEHDESRFIDLFLNFFPEMQLAPSVFLEQLIVELSAGSVISRELALRREFFYPCRGMRELEIDPFQTLFAQLSGLDTDEMISFQVTFKGCENSWGRSVNTLVQGDDGSPFLQGRASDVRAAQVKNSKPYFGVTVRLSSFAPTTNRCREILRPVAKTFECYEGENGYVLADPVLDQDERTIMVHISLRISRRSGMLLNGNELLGLVHFPGSEVYAPGLLRASEPVHEIPEELVKDEGLCLGTCERAEGIVPVTLSVSERLRHTHVLGASGTGKSTFIANSIIQDIEAGHGIALLDPHGDLVAQVLAQIPESRKDDVILFDPADDEFPIGFNMLSAKTDAEKNLLASDFVSIIQRLSTSWGDNMTSILGNAVMAFLESPRGGTLLDLRRFLNEEPFRTEYLKSVTEPEVRYFWTHEFPIVRGGAQASLVTRLGSFIRQKLLRNMVSQRGDRLDFAEIMDSGKIFLAPLAQGLIGEESSSLLGSTLVSKFYQTALNRQEIREEDRSPFFLYADEAHNFATPSIASIMSGARKYGLGLILAHQDLDQFSSRSSSTLSAVMTNAHTRVCFKLGDHDARKLEEGFEHFVAQDLRTLGRGEAVCRVGGSQNDFKLSTMAPRNVPEDSSNRCASITEASRQKYGTPRSEVEAQMADYYAAPPPKKRATKKATKKASEKEKDEPEIKVEKPKVKEKRKDKAEPVAPSVSDETPETLPAGKVEDGNKPAVQDEPLKSEESPASENPTPSSSGIQPLSAEAIEKAQPYKSVKKGETEGRGGSVHKSIQAQIKQQAIGMGLRAKIEGELPDKSGSVDVLIEGKTKKIAIEIAYKSPISQEVQNIRKCLPHDFDEIFVVSDDSDHLQKIKSTAKEAKLGAKLKSVTFTDISSLTDFLAEFGASLDPSETENLGYTVKTNFVTKSAEDTEARNDRIHKMLADLKKKRDEESG